MSGNPRFKSALQRRWLHVMLVAGLLFSMLPAMTAVAAASVTLEDFESYTVGEQVTKTNAEFGAAAAPGYWHSSSAAGYVSDAQAHSGTKSMRIGTDEYASLDRYYGANPQTGVVRLWIYDAGYTTNYVGGAEVRVQGDNTQGRAIIGVSTSANVDHYVYMANTVAWINSGVARSTGWHEFVWDYSSPTGLRMYIDGQLIYTGGSGAMTTYTRITLANLWPNAAGAGNYVYYDDVATYGEDATPPAGLAVGSVAGDTVTLSWNPVGSATSYTIYRDGEAIKSNHYGETFVDDNVPAGMHQYTVSSVNAKGESAQSAAAGAAIVGDLAIGGSDGIVIPPAGSVAHAYQARYTIAPDQPTVEWSLADPVAGVSLNGASGTLTVSSAAAVGAITLVATTADPVLTASKSIQLLDADDAENWPSGLAVYLPDTLGVDRADLRWKALPGAEAYKVYRVVGAVETLFDSEMSVTGSVYGAELTGLSPNTDYTFRVKSVADGAETAMGADIAFNTLSVAGAADFDISVSFAVGDNPDATQLTAGALLDAGIVVTSQYTYSQEVLFIVALYDDQDRMMNISYVSKVIAAGETDTMHAGFRLPDDVSGHSVKAFLWRGASLRDTTMEPLSGTYTLPGI